MATTDERITAVYRVDVGGEQSVAVAKDVGVSRKTLHRWRNNPFIKAQVEKRRQTESDAAPEPVKPPPSPEPEPAPEPVAPVLQLAEVRPLLPKRVKAKLLQAIRDGLVLRLALHLCRLRKDAFDLWEELERKGDKRAESLMLDIREARAACALHLLEHALAGGGGGKQALQILGRLHRKDYGESVPEERQRDDGLDQFDDDHLRTVAEAG